MDLPRATAPTAMMAETSQQQLIKQDPMKYKSYDHYPTYPDKSDANVQKFCVDVNAQLVLYTGEKGMFGRGWVMEARAEKMPAYMWWGQYGSSVPKLQKLACLVLSQPASASICERINSEFAFVKDRRRNRLAGAREGQQTCGSLP